MAHRYWCKFEYRLWRNDPELRLCSKETRGFWIDCIASMEDKEVYFLEGTIDEICRDVVCTEGEFKRSIAQLKRTNAATIEQKGRNVKIVSRKILKAVNLREYNRLKKQEERQRRNVKTVSKNSSKDIEFKEKKEKKEKDSPNGEPKKNAAPPPRPPTATRIPKPFPLTNDMWVWVLSELPDLEDVPGAHDKFVEHWTNDTGPKSAKVDWILAWKEGMKLRMKWQIEDQNKLKEELKNGTGKRYSGKRTDEDVIDESKRWYEEQYGVKYSN
jgi:hypothetical protein